MMKRMFLLLGLLALGGCNGWLATAGETAHNTVTETVAAPISNAIGSPLDPWPTMGALEVITIINTDKTIGDHVIGFVSGKDCSTVRANNDGPYCEEKPQFQPPAPPRTVWCYRSLAGVTCYDRPTHDSPNQYVGADTRSPPPVPVR